MDRRKLLLAIPHVVIGMVVAARLRNEQSPKPVARLLNNSKGCWYNGASDCACEGDDALVYQPSDLQGQALARWWQDISQLVKDDYAEWI